MDILLVLIGIVALATIAWNSVVSLHNIWQLARRAAAAASLRGYWADFFQHCFGGKISGLFVSLPVGVVAYVALIPIVFFRRAVSE